MTLFVLIRLPGAITGPVIGFNRSDLLISDSIQPFRQDNPVRLGADIFRLEISTQFRDTLLVALLIILSLSSLIGLFGHYIYFELATHFRMQYALAASACVVLLVVFHSWRLLPFAVCLAIFNWAYVLPYYSAPRRNDANSTAEPLRLMLANVLWGSKNYAALTRAIGEARADMVVLQEFTQEWHDHVQELRAEYPYYEPIPKPQGAGMALFSRYPLTGVEVLTLDASTHVAILARVNLEGTLVSILSLHPPTPMGPAKFVNRNRQFAEAASLLRSISGPKVLIGDLNTTMWSPYFKKLVSASGLRDARLGFGLRASWPVPLPSLLQLPIDHCLVSDDIAVVAVRTGGATGSDHRPLIFDLRIEKPKLEDQQSTD